MRFNYEKLNYDKPLLYSKYHCLQYPEWERRIALECSRRLKSGLFIDICTDRCIDDKVSEIACNMAYLEMWECKESDPTIVNYIFLKKLQKKKLTILFIYFLNVVNSFSHIVHIL